MQIIKHKANVSSVKHETAKYSTFSLIKLQEQVAATFQIIVSQFQQSNLLQCNKPKTTTTNCNQKMQTNSIIIKWNSLSSSATSSASPSHSLQQFHSCQNRLFFIINTLYHCSFIVFLLLAALLPFPIILAACRDTQPRACEAICTDDSQKNCTIRALVLLPDADDKYLASLRKVELILKEAEKEIKSQHLIPSHIKFEWMLHDDRCDASYAVIQAMDGVVMNCAHVIFGPVCDYPLGKRNFIYSFNNFTN